MDEFDRILKRDHVHRLGFVNLVENRGERCRLAAAGGAGDEDQAVFLPGHLIEDRAQAERMDRRHLALRFPHDDREGAALLENIDAKARPISELVAAIAGAALEQVAQEMALVADDVQGDLLGVERGELFDRRMNGGFLKYAVAFYLQWAADGKHQVG